MSLSAVVFVVEAQILDSERKSAHDLHSDDEGQHQRSSRNHDCFDNVAKLLLLEDLKQKRNHLEVFELDRKKKLFSQKADKLGI